MTMPIASLVLVTFPIAGPLLVPFAVWWLMPIAPRG